MIKLFESDPDPKSTALYRVRYKISAFSSPSEDDNIFISKAAFVLATSPKEAKTYVDGKNITSVFKHKDSDVPQILMGQISENLLVRYFYNSVQEWKNILGPNFRGLVHYGGSWVQLL